MSQVKITDQNSSFYGQTLNVVKSNHGTIYCEDPRPFETMGGEILFHESDVEEIKTETHTPVNVDQPKKDNKMQTETEINFNLHLVTAKPMKYVGANSESLDHDEWLRIRTTGIGGSDVANIMGVDGAFGSPLSTYHSKVGEPEPNEGSEPMRWGSILEETIRDEYAHRSGNPVVVVDATLYDPEYPHRLANTDGFVQENGQWGILEIKNVGYTSHEWTDGHVPQKYYCQVQWYMLITGLKFSKVVALSNGQQLIERHIDFDPKFGALMSDACDSFWFDFVEQGETPKATGNPRCREILLKMYPPTDDSIIELDEHQTDLDLWLEYSKSEKEFKKLKDQTANRILERVGNHTKASFQGKSVVSKSISNRRLCDYKVLEQDFPEAYAKAVKSSESISARITYKGAK